MVQRKCNKLTCFTSSHDRWNVAVIWSVDTVVGNSFVGANDSSICRCLAFPKERTHEEVVPADGVVLFNRLCVDVWNPEDGGKDSSYCSSPDDCACGDITSKVIEVELGRAFVDNDHSQDLRIKSQMILEARAMHSQKEQ